MPKPTIAFFGATGDCAGYCLASSLNAGYDCTALARTPNKLIDSMKGKGVDTTTIDAHLTIFKGRIVDYIVSGLGSTLVMQWSLWQPATLTDPTICQNAMKVILQALQQLQSPEKPTLLNISTTGIWPADKPRDVPIAQLPLYKWFLHVPHEDKRVQEELLSEHMRLSESERGFKAFVHVRPSLLTAEKGYGLDKVRYGTEEAPAVGYGMAKQDVGEWMYENLIRPGVKAEWSNSSVTLTS